jgi:hypothetical protein
MLRAELAFYIGCVTLHEGQVRTGAAGQVINQLPGKAMIMKNSSSSARLKFILFQVGPEALPLTVPVK